MNESAKPIFRHQFKESSFIKECAWNSDTEILAVIFKSSSIWIYEDVPYEIYLDLISAESAGNYFNKNIRSVYSSILVSKAGSTNG